MMKTVSILAAASLFGVVLWNHASSSPEGLESYCGTCDASAMIALDRDLFVIADDEDAVMRVFSRQQPGLAISRTNLSQFLGFRPGDEADIEGGARLGNQLFWITSHGNNRKGQEQESRQRFFAVTVDASAGQPAIRTVGRPYAGLLDDLLAEPRLARFQLSAALNLPPKTPGALNIEGLAATPDGALLIGFRNPVPRGGALIVPLLNPAEVVQGARARFGEPQQMDLGGHGIRSMERWRDGYLIIAGSIDGRGQSRLYSWSGGAAQPVLLPEFDFAGLNPEALAIMEQGGVEELFIVSDDGTRKIGGIECKRLKDPLRKTFRAVGYPVSPEVALRR